MEYKADFNNSAYKIYFRRIKLDKRAKSAVKRKNQKERQKKSWQNQNTFMNPAEADEKLPPKKADGNETQLDHSMSDDEENTR